MGTPVQLPADGLLGRDEELSALAEGLDEARDHRPLVFLVGGDAGIGKTRLLTELVARSDERVLWGGCLPSGERGVPYLPLIEMIRSLDDDMKESLPPALSALAPTGDAESEPASSRSQMFQAVIELFEDLASRAPLIVVVEDLHWADRSTRDLLDFLIGLLRDQRILLVCSIRTDDLPTDHPLRPQLAEWLRRSSVRRLDLEPLSPEDSLRLVTLLTDRELTRDQADLMVERADGNPFFLEELVAAGAGTTGPPHRMRDLLLGRTHDLSPDLLRLLRIASVGGTTIDEHLLSQVAELPIDETRGLLRAGIEAQVLTIDDRNCRFRHALVAETLHGDLLPAERREYHAAYADALSTQESSVPPGELATHQAGAGRSEEALAAWVKAGEAAESQFAFAEAQHGYQSALGIWDSVAGPEEHSGLTRVALVRRQAEMAFLGGEFEIACLAARDALELIDSEIDPITAALVHHRLARYLCDTADHNEALEHQVRAVELIPEIPPTPERAMVVSGLASILQFEGRYHEAHECAVEAISLATTTHAVEAETLARNILGNTTCIIEDVDLGLERIREALDLAEQTGDVHQQSTALWNMMANLFTAARWEETVVACRGLEEIYPRIGMSHWLTELRSTLVDLFFRLGRWDECEAAIEEAETLDPNQADLVGLSELHVAHGDLAAARRCVQAKVAAAAGDTESHLFHMVNLAEIELTQGNLTEATTLVDEVLERSEGLDVPLALGYGIVAALRAIADLAHQARLRNQGDTLAQSVTAGHGYHLRMSELLARPGPAEGWKREVGALAMQADAELTRLDSPSDPELWERANQGWLNLAMPYHASYCQFRWAEAALATGAERSEVAPLISELSDYLGGLGAKPLHDQVRALARRARIDIGDRYMPDPYGLTNREREVLAEVAVGSTNRQIAEVLYISEKTASVHVSNILRKLRASNRGEAAAKAVKEDLVGIEVATRLS